MKERTQDVPYPWEVGAVIGPHPNSEPWVMNFFWHGVSLDHQVCIIKMRTGEYHWCPCNSGAEWVNQLSEPFDTFEECAAVAAFINKCSANT